MSKDYMEITTLTLTFSSKIRSLKELTSDEMIEALNEMKKTLKQEGVELFIQIESKIPLDTIMPLPTKK